MNIDDQALPPLIIKALRHTLEGSSEKSLRELALAHPDLARGFRLGKANPAVLRARALSAFDRMHELPPAYRAILQEATLARSLFSVLSEEAIELVHEDLVAVYGLPLIAASMVLDERSTIRRLAFELLDGIDEVEPARDAATAGEGASAFVGKLSPFLDLLANLLTVGEDDKPTEAAGAQPLQTQGEAAGDARLRRERELLEELREQRTESKQLRREVDTLTALRDRMSAQLSALSAALREQRQRCLSLEAELNEWRGRFDRRVEVELAKQLDSRLLPWLAPAEALRTAVKESLSDNLLDAGQELLQRQSEIDLRYGLRSSLRTEIERHEHLRLRVESAQSDALNPLPELAQLAKRIKAHLTVLRQRLGEPTNERPDELTSAIERRLACASTLEELAQMRESLGSIGSLGVLTEAAEERLYERIRLRASTIYASVSRPHPGEDLVVDLADLPLQAIQTQLAGGTHCTLIIDGHNVLFGLPEMFGSNGEHDAVSGQARTRLEECLVELGRKHPSLDIHLWFDGGTLADRTSGHNVRIHFSGGSGANRADQRIEAHVRHLQFANPEMPKAVVTADRELARHVRESGALVMRPSELAIWFRRVESFVR